MKVLIITLFGALLGSVYCRNAWVTSRNVPDVIQEKAAKTTIVAYDKATMTEGEIPNEMKRLENECNCNVKNLDSVGVFILSHTNTTHPMAKDINLDPTKEIGADDEIVTVFDTIVPTDPEFSQQWALAELDNDADINIAEGWK